MHLKIDVVSFVEFGLLKISLNFSRWFIIVSVLYLQWNLLRLSLEVFFRTFKYFMNEIFKYMNFTFVVCVLIFSLNSIQQCDKMTFGTTFFYSVKKLIQLNAFMFSYHSNLVSHYSFPLHTYCTHFIITPHVSYFIFMNHMQKLHKIPLFCLLIYMIIHENSITFLIENISRLHLFKYLQTRLKSHFITQITLTSLV